MKTAHTPGPWAVGPMEGSQGCRIWQTDAENNAKKIVSFVVQAKPSRELDDETEANARLIAVSPELFDALDWLLNDPHTERGGHTAITYANEILAKALGETS